MQHNTNLPAVITADDITVDDLAGDDMAGDDMAGAARSPLELPPGLLRPLRVMVRWLPVAAIALGIAG